MQSGMKGVMFTISITVILSTFVLGQVTAPALAQTTPIPNNLIKRDFSFNYNQHLTARTGNDVVCGDHICAPGEWTKLQENLNHAQIVNSGTNSTTTMTTSANSTSMSSSNSSMEMPTNSTTQASMNDTQIPSSSPVPSTPAPIPTPPMIPSFVCTEVKADLGNSTISSNVTAKIMSDLGCNS